MKYDEDKFLQDVIDYISKTYEQHYVSGSDKDVQLIDLWATRGTALSTSIDTAMKYLIRYGKKGGYNIKDLYKAIHYITFAAFYTPKEKKLEKAPLEQWAGQPVGEEDVLYAPPTGELIIENIDNHSCDDVPINTGCEYETTEIQPNKTCTCWCGTSHTVTPALKDDSTKLDYIFRNSRPVIGEKNEASN